METLRKEKLNNKPMKSEQLIKFEKAYIFMQAAFEELEEVEPNELINGAKHKIKKRINDFIRNFEIYKDDLYYDLKDKTKDTDHKAYVKYVNTIRKKMDSMKFKVQ